jgi:hypothetical protein
LKVRDGVEIAIGKRDIQMLHQRTVLKSAGGDTVFYTLRDAAIDSGKVADAAGFGARIANDDGQRSEHFIDAGGLHF